MKNLFAGKRLVAFYVSVAVTFTVLVLQSVKVQFGHFAYDMTGQAALAFFDAFKWCVTFYIGGQTISDTIMAYKGNKTEPKQEKTESNG